MTDKPRPLISSDIEPPVLVEDPDRVKLSKRAFIAVGLVIGLAFAATIAIGAIALHQVSVESRSRSDANADLIHRIESLVHPTPRQYRDQLRRGIKLCLREPECRRLFPQLKSSSSNSGGSQKGASLKSGTLRLRTDTGGGSDTGSPFAVSLLRIEKVAPFLPIALAQMELLRLLPIPVP